MDPALTSLLTSLQLSITQLTQRFDAFESAPAPSSSAAPPSTAPTSASSPPVATSSPASPVSPPPAPAELLLTRTLLASALSRLEPLFDPLAPPDDAVLRANAWFIPWLRTNLLFWFEQQLAADEAVALWVHPFQRLLAVHASYRIPAPFAAIDKLEDRFVDAAGELIHKLLSAIESSLTTGLPIAPLHAFFTAAVTALRTAYPFLAERRRANDRPSRSYPAPLPSGSADPAAPASSESGPPASSHASVPARGKGRKGH